MSKISFLLALGALSVAFVACDKKDDKVQVEPAKEAVADTHAAPTAMPAPAMPAAPAADTHAAPAAMPAPAMPADAAMPAPAAPTK